MKKLLFVILFGILIFNCITISAKEFGIFGDIKTDNYKEYEQNGKYGTISVIDSGQFSEDTLLSETTLDYNTDFCLINCEARGTTILYYDLVLFEEFTIYDLNNNKQKLKEFNNYTIYIKDGEKEKEVDNYIKICNDKLTSNGTITECNKVLNGTKIIYEPKWKEYNGKKLIAGTYEWKITGKKNLYGDLDWTFKTQGLESTEWASWNSTYNTNLMDYFFMSSNVNSVNASRNLSVLDGQITFNTTAINGLSGKFSDTQTMNVTQSTEATVWSFNPVGTLNFWVYIQADGGTEVLFDKRAAGDNFLLSKNAAEQLQNSNGGLTSSALSIGVWHMGTYVINSSGQFFYTDGSLDGSYETAYGGTGTVEIQIGDGSRTGQTDFNGNLDEIAYWDRQLSAIEISDLYNGGTGIFYVDTTPTSITTTLNSPPNYFNTSSSSVQFNCSTLAVSSYIRNISLEIDGVTKTTTNDAGSNTYLQINSTQVVAEGSHNWTCRSSNNNSEESVAIARNISIDLSSPSIIINYGNGTLDYGSLTQNKTLNYTITDVNLQSCWLNYNGTNSSIPCTSGQLNTTSFGLEENVYYANLYSNDSFGFVSNFSFTWDYYLFENLATYNTNTIEGVKENFILNFTKSSSIQISSVNLIYNTTTYSTTFTSSNNEVISTSSIIIPSVEATSTIPFKWNVLLTNGKTINTSIYNQTVNVLLLGNCSIYNNLIYNFTLFDEEKQTALNNGTIEVQVNLYDLTKTTQVLNFSQKYEHIHEADICINGTILTTTNFSSDAVIKYYTNQSNIDNSSTNYVTEYYNILGDIISNTTIPNHIKLYNLKTEDSTDFQLTFRDSSYVLAGNILVYLYRQYVSDNDYKVVEVPVTDSNGQTILHLVRNDVVYNLVMIDADGNIIATFNKVIAFCQDYTIGSCFINLNAPQGGFTLYNYTDDLGVSYTTPTYSNTTGLITFNFVTTNLSAATVSTEIIRNSDFGNRSVCTDSITSSSGLLSCNVSSISDTDRFLFINVYVNGELKSQSTIDLENSGFNFGTFNGAFYAFLLILIMVLMFSNDKQTLIVSLIIGWAVILSFGLIKGSLVGNIPNTIVSGIWLLTSLVIVLWKVRKEEKFG